MTDQGGRPSDSAIERAMWKWRGRVVAVAEELGLRRNRLYERLAAMGKSPRDFRLKSSPVAGQDREDSPDNLDMSGRRVSGVVRPWPGVRDSSGAPSCPPAEARTFPAVASSVAVASKKQIRILPEHEDMIRRARRRIAFAIDRDLTDEACLADFIDEALEPWLAGKLEGLNANAPDKPTTPKAKAKP